MVTVTLKSKGQKQAKGLTRLPSEFDIEPLASVESLYQSLSKITGLDPHRLRLTLIDNTVLSYGHDLEKYDLQAGSILYVKDLGQYKNSELFLFGYTN